jgi:hypothetical protein
MYYKAPGFLAPGTAEDSLQKGRRPRGAPSIRAVVSCSAREEEVSPVGGVRVHVQDVGAEVEFGGKFFNLFFFF